jgi:alpha-glucosidase
MRSSLFRPWLSPLVALTLAVSAHALDLSGFTPIGAVERVVRHDHGVELGCADGATVQVNVLAPDLIRVRALFAGQPAEPDHSWAIARTEWDPVPWQLNESAADVVLTTAELEVVIHRSPLEIEFRDAATHHVINADQRPMARNGKTGHVTAAKKLGLDEHFYGLGEKAAHLDRRRGEFVMWNSDTPAYAEGTDPIYQSIPFYLGWENGDAYGLFYDNSYRTFFDFGRHSQEAVDYAANGGELNYYFFHGPSLKKIVSRYTVLTGRMPLPPLWSLGNQQCRYSYYPDTLVEDIARTYRTHDLPLDVLYLDIHYMNGYRDFTWNPQRFPDPKGMIARLKAEGVKVVTIVDPGVKYQPPAAGAPSDHPSVEQSYDVYNQGLAQNFFLRRANGELYIGEVWPGKAVFVDYTKADARKWWGDMHKPFVDIGVAGIWDDMNEPSDFIDQSGKSQADVVFDDLGTHSSYNKNRNTFALNEVRATYEGLQRLRPNERPFIVTRAGYAGVQRYSTMWTGDSKSTWESLSLALPMFASLGLSGETFVGADLPGFMGRTDGEMLARSYEMAFLVPLCRNHCAIDDYDHEPWRFGPRYEDVVRKYLKLRYQLLPFLYTTMEEAHRTGVPLFRPLLLNYQDDLNTLTLDDEYMVGDALLAAPVLRPGQRQRDVYLPKGTWYDFWSDERLTGGKDVTAAAPLDRVPLYVRGGSIVPTTVAMNYVGEKPWDPLRFEVYPDATGTAEGSLYEDDGTSPAYRDGMSRRTSVHLSRDGAGYRLVIDPPVGGFKTPPRQLEFSVHGIASDVSVSLDGRDLQVTTAADKTPGWFRERTDILVVRLADDGSSHQLAIR